MTRHEGPVKGLLVQSLVACAKQGLVSVDVVAGDGTKVKANASMAANAIAGQLEIEVAELEALLAAEVQTWFAQAQAADAAEDALFGDGDGGPGTGGGPGTLTRLAGKIVRRQRAKAKLDTEETARRQQAEAQHAGKITRLEARTAARRADAERATGATLDQMSPAARRRPGPPDLTSRRHAPALELRPVQIHWITKMGAGPGHHQPL